MWLIDFLATIYKNLDFIYKIICCTLGQLLLYLYVDKKHKQRTIIFYKDYFQMFFEKQKEKVKDKIIWTFDLIEELPKVPETYLKRIENTNGLYEIKVQIWSDIFRIFCFFCRRKISSSHKRISKEKSKDTPKRN